MALMDLVAGDRREIALVIALDDWAAFADRRRFDAFLPLGEDLDPAALDDLARAIRDVLGGDGPMDFPEARIELPGASMGDRTVELIEPAWVRAVAAVPDGAVPGIARRWRERHGDVREDDDATGPDLLELAGSIVAFCRAAADARDVVLAWAF